MKNEDSEMVMESKISSGSDIIDNLLKGGYETGIITTVYGPSGSGKTNLCLIALANAVKNGEQAIFIDTEGGFSVTRLKQICNDEKILENVFFLKPTNFKEQKDAFENLKKFADKNIKLIIVDTISMLYRVELGKNSDIYEINKELGKQISCLSEIARKKNIAVLMTNQVYSSFDERDDIKMVGGDMLKYFSKCLMELQCGHKGVRKAILKKHRNIPEGNDVMFRIVQKGIEGMDKNEL